MKKGILLMTSVILLMACMNQPGKEINAVLPSYIDIVEGQTIISDTSIICEINLANLPISLSFNNDLLMDDALEYEWGVYFDNNNDGNYDISFTVSNWNFPRKTEIEGEIIKNTQSNIWRVSNEGAEEIGDLDLEIDGNKMVLKSSNSSIINEISSNPKLKYKTFYNNGHDIFIDSLIIE